MQERITTAGVIIKDGRYLMGQRLTEGSINNGKWEFIGGKNRWGESEEETLKREFAEELGVDIAVGGFLTQVDFINADTLYHLRVYSVSLESGDFHLSVHSRVAFFSLEEMDDLDMVDSDRRIVDFLKKAGVESSQNGAQEIK